MKKIFCMILAFVFCVLAFSSLYSCSKKENTVLVTFHKNEAIAFYNGDAVKKSGFAGGVYKSVSVEKGSYVNAPENPTASSLGAPLGATYVFGGWYKEPACENAFDFNSEPINTDITLYAKWIQIPSVFNPS